MLEDTETYCTLCVVVITNLDSKWDAKSKTFFFFSSITKYIQALHSRPHQTPAHVNSALNWQFKWATQSMTHKIPLGFVGFLTHFRTRNQKYILKMHIRATEISIFILCPRGFFLWFSCGCKRIFHLLFCRLVKAISSVQLQMLIMQHKAVLGRAGVLQVPWKCTGLISHKEVEIYN